MLSAFSLIVLCPFTCLLFPPENVYLWLLLGFSGATLSTLKVHIQKPGSVPTQLSLLSDFSSWQMEQEAHVGWLWSHNVKSTLPSPKDTNMSPRWFKRHSLVKSFWISKPHNFFSVFLSLRCNSFIENSSALKKPQAKLKKMHNLGHKNNNPPKEPQPKRVEEVYRALKNGLE